MRAFTPALILIVALLASTPVSGQQQTPAPAAPAPPAAAPAEPPDGTGSLFANTWRQFQIGGRFTGVDGDPARFQRFRDLRSGVLFTNARYEREWAATGQRFEAAADNVGWRDGRYVGMLDRPGRFTINGSWDMIPQFYSVDTRTPYGGNGATLTLDDATQRAIQNAQATTSAYIPLATQFDMIERRDTGLFSASIAATNKLQLTTTFRTQKHVGELPWGASFGFSNDVEVPLPYTSRTNDFGFGAEWSDQKSMLRVGYDGSWFTNNDDTLVWDSPLRLDDSSSSGPGRGRMSLWPTNQAHTFSVAGSRKFPGRTQFTGFLSYGVWSNDSTLQPFTINSQLPVIALPRASAEAQANVFSTNFGLVSRPSDDWRVTARVRTYSFDNQTPTTAMTQYVSYDNSVNTPSTGGPFVLSHARGTITADATWTGLEAVSLGVGYARNHGGYVHRIFSDANEDVLSFTADALTLSWGSVRGQAEFSDRRGSDLDEALLLQIGDQAGMRHYDIANRQRRKFEAILNLFPNDTWNVSVNAGGGRDEYDDSSLGLQESSFRVAGVAIDYQKPNGLGAGVSYNFERYSGFQVSRSAGSTTEAADPLRDWTTDSSEDVHYFSLYVTPPRIGRNTEARLVYDYSDARANYVYAIPPGSPLVPPNQLPEAYNTLHDLRAELRHRLSNRLALTVSYLFENFKVYDFALDPSVIDSIVQPSSLVLGYVYRPYTANSAVVGLLYRF
jgi:MtrB/PioB family decaheme-associated outer membrane protein